jgi:hypothetical protein
MAPPAIAEPRASLDVDMDQALVDFKDLRELAALQNFDLFGLIRELSDAGASSFVIEVDSLTAIPTGNGVVRYKLADRLLVCLAALRAKQVHPHESVGGSFRHKSDSV